MLRCEKTLGAQAGCKSLVFSSSACVYGNPATVPITEDFPLSCTNPYGRTKLFIEEMLRDVAKVPRTAEPLSPRCARAPPGL